MYRTQIFLPQFGPYPYKTAKIYNNTYIQIHIKYMYHKFAYHDWHMTDTADYKNIFLRPNISQIYQNYINILTLHLKYSPQGTLHINDTP